MSSRGVNKIILIGNVGDDPDVKYTQSGTAITTISLATSSVRKDRDGNSQESTQWHRLKSFGKSAEILAEYVRKGHQLYIEGRIEYGSYEKDGVKRYTTDIIVEDFQFLGGQRGGNDDGGEQRRSQGGGASNRSQQGNTQRGQQGNGNRQAQPQRGGQRPAPAPATLDDGFGDDDIPFEP